MRGLRAAFLVALAGAFPARAGDATAVVAEMTDRILARGHGQTCSLAMVPVRGGGYYPCVDFGPYRVVKEYGRISAYVVQDGKSPYLVMTGGERGAGFVVPGPWETDLPARIVMFWNDVVEGGLERGRRARETDAQRQEAEAYIRKLTQPEEKAAPTATAAPGTPPPPAIGGPAAGGGVVEALTAGRGG